MSNYVCLICRGSIPNDDVHHQYRHTLQPTWSKEKSPLSFTVSVQSHYNEPHRNAIVLAEARKELKEFFPGKEFEIQPGRLMLCKQGENSVIIGEAYVATYLVFEK